MLELRWQHFRREFSPELYAIASNSPWSHYANPVVLLIYGAVTLSAVMHHSAWRDEAYIWLMARDLTFGGLFRELKYNGSPGLWHSIIFALAKSGLPYESQQYLHWAMSCLAAGILLYRSPFGWPLRVLILSSYFILYEHAIIVRVYLISIVLLYAICDLYPDKLKHPIWYGCLVGLLANANSFGVFAGALFGGNFLFDVLKLRHIQIQHVIALFTMLIAGLVSIVSIYPPKDGFSYYRDSVGYYAPANVVLGPICGFFGKIDASSEMLFPMGMVSVGIIGLTLMLLWRRAAYFPLMLLTTMWLVIAYITIFRYPWSSPRHFSFYFIYTITALWLGKSANSSSFVWAERAICCLLLAALGVSTIAGMAAYREEIFGLPYSGSKKLAAFIHEHQLADHTFVGYGATRAAAVLPYVPGIRMWYPQLRAFGTYLHMVPNVRSSLEKSEIVALAANSIENADNLLYVFDSPLMPEDPPLELLAIFCGQQESYWLYTPYHNPVTTQRQRAHGN